MTKPAKAILKSLLFVCLVFLGNLLAHWFVDRLDFGLTPANEPQVHRILMFSMVVYIVLMAIPFVPGVEIGVAVMMSFGPKIVLLVYVATLAALSLSFVVGRFIPEPMLVDALRSLRMKRTGDLLADMEGLNPEQRLELMLQRSTKKLVSFLLKYRYVALMVAINLPGNMIIGGGGGIALMAGMSRLFSPHLFLLAVAIAISPVPLAWLFFGNQLITPPL